MDRRGDGVRSVSKQNRDLHSMKIGGSFILKILHGRTYSGRAASSHMTSLTSFGRS